jgi:hypothetical protein
MAISIIGREFDENAAALYAKNVAIRSPLRDSGINISERNRIAREQEAKRLGRTNNQQTSTPPAEPASTLPEWRTMYMMAPPGYEYVFPVAPASFNVEGFGAELSEIPRPYNIPLVDIKAGKSRRVSFEFLVVKRANGDSWEYINNFYASIEDEIKRIQLIADMGMPVGFDNINAILSENYWYIDNITFNYTRDNRTGATVSAQCNISLIEYKPLRQKFILLPKFRYGKFPTTKKPPTTTGGEGFNDPAFWRERARRNAIALKGQRGLFSQ